MLSPQASKHCSFHNQNLGLYVFAEGEASLCPGRHTTLIDHPSHEEPKNNRTQLAEAKYQRKQCIRGKKSTQFFRLSFRIRLPMIFEFFSLALSLSLGKQYRAQSFDMVIRKYLSDEKFPYILQVLISGYLIVMIMLLYSGGSYLCRFMLTKADLLSELGGFHV